MPVLVQEDEADYQATFPEHFSTFADLVPDEVVDLDAAAPLQLQAQQQQGEQVRGAGVSWAGFGRLREVTPLGMWRCLGGTGVCIMWGIDFQLLNPAAPTAALPKQAQQAAAYSARELVQGEVLRELVAVHRAAFAQQAQHDSDSVAAPAVAGSEEEEAQRFLLSYELGTAVLRSAGLCLPAAVDGSSAGGHLMALALRHRQLSQPPAGGKGWELGPALMR